MSSRAAPATAYDAAMRLPFGALALLLACSGTNPGPRPAEDDDYVGRDAQVERATLRFRDPADAARFDRVHACFAARATGDGWRRYPLRQIGNFVQQDWCRGAHDRHCAGGSFRSDPGDEWYQVHTLHYDQDWPEVFGLGVAAGRHPQADGWGVAFWYGRGGANIIGDTVSASFHRFVGGKIAQSVDLGSTHVYKLEETRIEVAAPGSQDDELALLIASPASLRTTGLARLDALTAAVVAKIESGGATKCVYGPYEGNGIPPVCNPTPLSPAERTAALAAARAELGARREAVDHDADELHRLLTELMAFDRCW